MVLPLGYKNRLKPLKHNLKAEEHKCAYDSFCYWYRVEVSRYLSRIKKKTHHTICIICFWIAFKSHIRTNALKPAL